MNIKPIFERNETPTLEEYLKRCGVNDPQEYINANWVEEYVAYNNIKDGVQKLRDAILDDGKIVLVCDCDCDGYCATTIAYQFLTYQGVSTHDIIILFHSGKQHGLSKDILEQLHALLDKDVKISLLWIPDAGTNDIIESSYFAKSWGIPVLITDHHEFDKQWIVYKNVCVINNQQLDNPIQNKYLCGAGVTHKLITAYDALYGGDIHKKLIDLVALATIGDVMDMRNLENRTIVRWGLKHINNPFLRVMCKEFISDSETTPTTLAWNVIPKINAVCRSDNDTLKEELFDALAMNYYSESLIDDIKKCHAKQREETDKIYQDVLKSKPLSDEDVKIFLAPNTPYTGLIASKLSEHFNCPCMVVHENPKSYTGSLRSPCNMRTKLSESGLLFMCAGHEQACGVGWAKGRTKQLSTYCRQLDLTPEPKQVMYSVDNVFINPNVFDIGVEGAELWGTGIPEPLVHVSNITINGQDIKEIGSNKTTIKWLYGDIEFLSFFMSKEKKNDLNVGKDVDMQLEIIGTPTINTFRDKDTKQIVIKEWEICQK